MEGRREVKINGRVVTISNLDKLLWPDAKVTKAKLLEYYAAVFPYLAPHLQGRPLVVTRWPDGINGKSFYQKNCPDHAPEWVTTFSWSREANRDDLTHYILCNNLETLIWLGNLAALELHPWLSTVEGVDNPNFIVFDLDPSVPGSFSAVREIALVLREILTDLGLVSYPKTSGATGLHIYVPIQPRYSYTVVRKVAEVIASLTVQRLPHLATITRHKSQRGTKVYVDFLQNVRGQTICAPYSPRPRPGAPISTPLWWDEVNRVNPQEMTMDHVLARVKEQGDIFSPVLTNLQDLDLLLVGLGLGRQPVPT